MTDERRRASSRSGRSRSPIGEAAAECILHDDPRGVRALWSPGPARASRSRPPRIAGLMGVEAHARPAAVLPSDRRDRGGGRPRARRARGDHPGPGDRPGQGPHRRRDGSAHRRRRRRAEPVRHRRRSSIAQRRSTVCASWRSRAARAATTERTERPVGIRCGHVGDVQRLDARASRRLQVLVALATLSVIGLTPLLLWLAVRRDLDAGYPRAAARSREAVGRIGAGYSAPVSEKCM